jgi:hypothetical protein
MALTICSQFLADTGRTEAMSFLKIALQQPVQFETVGILHILSPNELSALVQDKA